MTVQQPTKQKVFTPYQVFMISVLAVLQFTIVLDFMVLSPLGVLLLEKLSLKPTQFTTVVSAYAFSAGAAGLLAAGFADKFDRKKLLLFFFVGFMLGTVLCALADSYEFLLMARIVTGIFGGVISSISFAIITDLFKMEVRGRVMGLVQSAFAASQVLGLPIGLYLATKYAWHAPFWMIAGVGSILGIVIFVYMKPVTAHLSKTSHVNPFKHLLKTLSNSQYALAFVTTTMLATGGFMLMPFSSTFTTHNIGIPMEKLPLVYLITGICAMGFGPLIGKLSDKAGKYFVFLSGSILSIVMVAIYVNLGITPLWGLILLNIILFAGISSRMISSSALMTAVPQLQDRGAFMSINAAVQQLAGGIGAYISGLIVVQTSATSPLRHYDTLGYVVIGAMAVVMVMMYFVNRMVQRNLALKAMTGNSNGAIPAQQVIIPTATEQVTNQ